MGITLKGFNLPARGIAPGNVNQYTPNPERVQSPNPGARQPTRPKPCKGLISQPGARQPTRPKPCKGLIPQPGAPPRDAQTWASPAGHTQHGHHPRDTPTRHHPGLTDPTQHTHNFYIINRSLKGLTIIAAGETGG